MTLRGFLTGSTLLAGAAVCLAFTLARPPEPATFVTETYARGLDNPWGLAFLPDGRLLVTERSGNLRIVGTDGAVSEPVAGVPEVCACGQGGLLDVELHPDYASNGWIYLSFSDRMENAAGEATAYTSIMRARLSAGGLTDQEILYQAPDSVYTTRPFHFGSRIVFDDAGYLFFSIGDRGQQNEAQRLDLPNGKVHRIHDDGHIPADNPFIGHAGALPTIWSYGHRNPQGMDRHPVDGTLWAAEHGPQGGDELNHVRPGLNFGWPVISYGVNYDGSKFTDITEKEGMEQPATYWNPSIATCGIGFYAGTAFPEWENNLFVTSLKFGELRRLVIEGDEVVEHEMLWKTAGRLRDVVTGPDGFVYVAVEGPEESIVRLKPSDA